jgi:hypothetical protein
MKYSGKPRVEVFVKDGVNHPDTDDIQIDNETNKRMDAWIHGSHLTDNKLLNDLENIKTGQLAIIRRSGSQPLKARSI